jgi:hypothetical protein
MSTLYSFIVVTKHEWIPAKYAKCCIQMGRLQVLLIFFLPFASLFERILNLYFNYNCCFWSMVTTGWCNYFYYFLYYFAYLLLAITVNVSDVNYLGSHNFDWSSYYHFILSWRYWVMQLAKLIEKHFCLVY